MMKRPVAAWLTALLVSTVCLCVCAHADCPIASKLLAALPTLDAGMTKVTLSADSTGFQVAADRAIGSHVLVRGAAGTRGAYDLSARLLAPLDLAPAFFAVEVGTSGLTGLMTVFFGPVSIDLGRTWFDPVRWALVQLVVHPRLSLVFGGAQQSGPFLPQIGWRFFPTGTARWEIAAMLQQGVIRLSLGGVL